MRPPLRALAPALALLLIGGAAILTAPNDDAVHGPIPVVGQPGHPVTGRLASVTITDVRVANQVRLPDGARYGEAAPVVPTHGIWVVVDADVTVNVARVPFNDVELRSGGEHFRVAPSLPGEYLTGTAYRPGVPTHGSFVFEVPKRLAGTRVEFWLTPDIDTHDDTVPVVPLELGAEVRERVTVEPPAVRGVR